MTNHLYWLDIGEGCMGIIAPNMKRARVHARNYEFYGDTFDNYIDMTRCLTRAKEKTDVSKFPEGEVEVEFGLRNGIYSFVIEYPCEKCGKDRACSMVDEKIICGDCESAPNADYATTSGGKR